MPGSVEGLPLRLIIGVVVLGVTAPTVFTGLSAYETQQVGVRVLAGIEDVVRLAQRFYLVGGGAQEVRVDFGGGLTARVEYVAIGDAAGGALASTARYKVTGQAEAFLVARPPVPLAGPDGALVLGPGVHTVRVSFTGVGPVRLTAG